MVLQDSVSQARRGVHHSHARATHTPSQSFLPLTRSHDESEARNAFVIIHGVKRNADVYFKVLNNAWAKARDAGSPEADKDSIRVAPLFFSTVRDEKVLNDSTLAWPDPNAWTGGDGSNHPAGSNVSVFTVLDGLLQRFADKTAYPKLRRLTFVAHGGGAQVLQRYAVLGQDVPSDSDLEVRYVIGDPSTQLYFTQDRPVPVDTSATGPESCPTFNDFRYGLDKYTAPYLLMPPMGASDLFKRYLSRDVHYLVGANDTRADKGDQLCGGLAAGGSARRDRNDNYWAYLHLLSGKVPTPKYPGWFPALDSGKKGPTPRTSTSTTSSSTTATSGGAKSTGAAAKGTKSDDDDDDDDAVVTDAKKAGSDEKKDKSTKKKSSGSSSSKSSGKKDSTKKKSSKSKAHSDDDDDDDKKSKSSKTASAKKSHKTSHSSSKTDKRDDSLPLLDDDDDDDDDDDTTNQVYDPQQPMSAFVSDSFAGDYPTSQPADRAGMDGVDFKHHLQHVKGAGHSASEVLGSSEGRTAIFGK